METAIRIFEEVEATVRRLRKYQRMYEKVAMDRRQRYETRLRAEGRAKAYRIAADHVRRIA